MNKLLRLNSRRIQTLEHKIKEKEQITLIVNLLRRDNSIFYQIKTLLPKGWNKK